jgi:nucleotide-binding universal stress UspA family protein
MKPTLPMHILCPVDMSAASGVGLRYAGVIARRLGAAVHVIHSHGWTIPVEFMTSGSDLLLEEYARWQAAETREIQELARTHLAQVECDVTLVEDDIVEAVVQKAASGEVDLIVLSTHGRAGFDRVLHGSVTEDILRRVDKPVLAIRRPSARSPEDDALFRELLCPVNFTDVAREALYCACEFSEVFDSHLDVIYAVEPGSQETEATVRERLCAWVPEMTNKQCSCELVVRSGHAAEEIIKRATSHKADIIVIGAQKRPFLETTLFGTTTERVIRHSSCPVLVIPRGYGNSA